MAIRITLRKADRDILAVLDQLITTADVDAALELDKRQLRQWTGFYERVLKVELAPKKGKDGSGVAVRRAIEIFRGVLGRRLILPAGAPSEWWFVQQQNKLNASGITEELAKKAAEVAKTLWRGSIGIESLIRNVDRLLSDSTAEQMGDLKEEAGDMDEL